MVVFRGDKPAMRAEGPVADYSFGIAFGDAYIKLELIVSPPYAL